MADLQRKLDESIAHQAATIGVLRVMSSTSSETQPVFHIILKRAVELCDAMFGCFFEVADGMMHIRAMAGWNEVAAANYKTIYPRPFSPDWLTDRAILAGQLQYVPNILEARRDTPQVVRDLGFLSQVTVPLLRDGVAFGCFVLAHRDEAAFTDAQIALLQTFAEQAVITMGSVANFRALQDRTADLTEALEQQNASADILGVISNSVADAKPVFDKILESCKHLFGGDELDVLLVDEQGQLNIAVYIGDSHDVVAATFPAPVELTPAAGRSGNARRSIGRTSLAASMCPACCARWRS
jgi:hypothetical protein